MRILVVDDSPVTRAIVSDLLQVAGHEIVAEAENGRQALEELEKHKPDLITLDLALGEEDGIQVLKKIRKVDAKAKILIVSANIQEGVYDQALKEGANGFIVKPFTLADIAAAVTKAAGA